MGKRAGKSIEWATHTWNPVKGRCLKDPACEYCYMQEFFRRFPRLDHEPRLSEAELRWKAPKGALVFVGSSLDLFHPRMPRGWVLRTIQCAAEQPHAVFAFLTKFPSYYFSFRFPQNVMLGTTFDGLTETQTNIEQLETACLGCRPLFVSFEPLIRPLPVDIERLDWIIIGADSRRGAKKAPDDWARELMRQAEAAGIPVWLKDNYRYAGEVPKQRPALRQYLCVEQHATGASDV